MLKTGIVLVLNMYQLRYLCLWRTENSSYLKGNVSVYVSVKAWKRCSSRCDLIHSNVVRPPVSFLCVFISLLSLPSGVGAVLPQGSNSVVTISDLTSSHSTISLSSSRGKKKNLLYQKPSASVSCLKDLHELMNTLHQSLGQRAGR